MKYEIPEDATSNDAYKDWFSELNARVVQYLFNQKCLDIVEAVEVDETVFSEIPPMSKINANYSY